MIIIIIINKTIFKIEDVVFVPVFSRYFVFAKNSVANETVFGHVPIRSM